MIELDLMDNEIALYLNWKMEFSQDKLKDFQIRGHYPPLLYFDRHNSVNERGSLWLNFPPKIKDVPLQEAWISRDIEKISPVEMDEIRFWINGNIMADGSDKHPYYLYFTLDTFRKRGIYWSVPITKPGTWELKRLTLKGDIQERIFGRKMHLTRLDEPASASKVYFHFIRPPHQSARDIRLNIDHLMALPKKEQPTLLSISYALEAFFRKIEKELKIRFDVVPNPTPQDLKKAIKNLTLRFQNVGAKQNWPRGNYHDQKSNFIYRFAPPDAPKLLSFATRPPVCPYELDYYIEILSPKEREKYAEALIIRNHVLKKLAAQPYLWVHGEKVPMFLESTPPQESLEEKNLEDPNALKITVSATIETGEWKFHVLDKLQVMVSTGTPHAPYLKSRESVFDLSYVIRLQGYTVEQTALVLDRLQKGRTISDVHLIKPQTFPPLIRVSFPGTGTSKELLKYIKRRLARVDKTIRPEKVTLTQNYDLEVIEVVK